MIVRNERQHLERCLRSVNGLADDIVVVDTGSDDGTQAIALRAGARLFNFPWVDDFALARNQALGQARAPWILALDADEQLLERDRLALGQLLRERRSGNEPPRNAFNLVVKNSSDGGRSGMLAHIVRLFPNHPGVRYEWPVHEQVATSLLRLGIPILNTDVEILHDGYADASRNTAKQQRNLSLLQRQVAGGETGALTFFLLGGARLDLGNFAEAIAAYQECVARAAAGDSFAIAARVRIATCLYRQGRFAEACQWTHETDSPGPCHPEQLLVRGNSLKALGNSAGAMDALCAVLAQKEAIFMPPCNLTSVKLEAVLAIASLLKIQGHEAAAVKLMRAAVAKRAAAQPVDLAWVKALLP
jgi:tetratricopeptide (TPR) repeat protein